MTEKLALKNLMLPHFSVTNNKLSLLKKKLLLQEPRNLIGRVWNFSFFWQKFLVIFLWARVFDLIWSQTAAETAAAQAKKKHMSDKELKAKIEVLPTRW